LILVQNHRGDFFLEVSLKSLAEKLINVRKYSTIHKDSLIKIMDLQGFGNKKTTKTYKYTTYFVKIRCGAHACDASY